VKPAPIVTLEQRFPFFYGWVVLSVATLGVFISGPAQTYGVAVFIDPMLLEMGWSRSIVSGTYSAASVVAGLSMLLLGRYLDRIGARRVITGLAILYGFACFGMALVATPLGLAVGFTALRIIGQASLVLACSTLAALWFVRRRGRAMSITVLGMAASNAVFPPVLVWIIGIYGWRTGWVIVGAFIWIALIIPAAVLIRDRPEAIGLEPDGISRQTSVVGSTTAIVEYDWTLQQAVRSRNFWLLVVASVAPGTVMTGLVFHQVSFFATRGLSAQLAASTLSVYAIAFAVTTFVVGGLLDRIPARHVLISGLLMLPLTVGWVMALTTPFQAIVYGIMLGMVLGTNSTTSSVLWASYYGRRNLGSIRGITQAAIIVSAATGPLMLSVPYDLLGSYTPGLWIMIVFPLVCALAAALAGPPSPPPDQVRLVRT
jgi:MFS family permease